MKPEILLKSRLIRVSLLLSLVAVFWMARLPAPLFAFEIGDVISTPADGEEYDPDQGIQFTFLQPMTGTVAVQWENTGDATISCDWLDIGGTPSNQIVTCSVEGALPAGNTVTWTLNPDGTGFVFQSSGMPLPTTTGTFTVPDESSNPVTFVVTPRDGETLIHQGGDPAGSVTFTFSADMDTSVDILWENGISNEQVSCDWNSATTLICEISPPLAGGSMPQWTINPNDSGVMQALDGRAVNTTTGSFTVSDDGSDPLTVFSTPEDGGELNPLISSTVSFIFTAEMAEEPISIEWDGLGSAQANCEWFTFPGQNLPRTTLDCTFSGGLAPGSEVTWTVNPESNPNKMQDLSGREVPTTSGSFTVFGDPGTGGGPGDPAPLCPEELMAAPFPKRTYVCGEDMIVWDSASVFPFFGGSGFLLDASTQGENGSFPSLIKYDETGMAEWKAILPEALGDLAGSSADNLVFAARGGTLDSPALEFGVFDAANGFTPVFRNSIASIATQHFLSHDVDGATVLFENAGSTVSVTVFDANGAVSWAKQYSSDLFLDSPGGISGDSQTARISRIHPEGYLLQVVISEQDAQAIPPVVTNTIVLARLSADGSVQWARSFDGLEGVSALAPTVSAGPSGAFYLHFTETQFDGANVSFSSKIIKLNGTGVVQWGKVFEDLNVSFRAELANDDVLGVGFAANLGSGENSELTPLLFVLDENTGNIQNQVGVSKDGSDILSVSGVSGSRIYYSLLSSDGTSETSTMDTASVGYSTHQLGGFTFREYTPRQFGFGSLFYNEMNGDLIFSGFSDEDHAVDIVSLNADLQPEADCDLFTQTTVTTSDPGIAAANTTLSSSTITLGGSDFSPTVAASELAVGAFDASEMSLCEDGTGGGDCTDPVILSISRSSETEVTVEFGAREGCSYILRRATSLNPPNWIPVGAAIPGTGVPVSLPFTVADDEAYFQAATLTQ